jgi:hypothetical protein
MAPTSSFERPLGVMLGVGQETASAVRTATGEAIVATWYLPSFCSLAVPVDLASCRSSRDGDGGGGCGWAAGAVSGAAEEGELDELVLDLPNCHNFLKFSLLVGLSAFLDRKPQSWMINLHRLDFGYEKQLLLRMIWNKCFYNLLPCLPSPHDQAPTCSRSSARHQTTSPSSPSPPSIFLAYRWHTIIKTQDITNSSMKKSNVDSKTYLNIDAAKRSTKTKM